MSLIAIEDQSPIMRRAKIRAAVAMVLLLVAIGSLLMLNEQAPSLPANTKSAPAVPVTAAPAQPTAPQATSQPATQSIASTAANEPEAKPPVAPPDPVYTSFTATTPVAEPIAVAPEPTSALPPVAEAPQKQPEVAQLQSPPVSKPTPSPKAERPAEKAEKLETSSTGSHILQVGVFADMNNARKQQAKLAASGIRAHTSTKLRIGPFASSEDAEAAREKARASGIGITVADHFDSGSRGLSMQAGVYTDMGQASHLQASLSERGLPAYTETRLLVGPFATKAKADVARNKIKKLNISVVLIPNR